MDETGPGQQLPGLFGDRPCHVPVDEVTLIRDEPLHAPEVLRSFSGEEVEKVVMARWGWRGDHAAAWELKGGGDDPHGIFPISPAARLSVITAGSCFIAHPSSPSRAVFRTR